MVKRMGTWVSVGKPKVMRKKREYNEQVPLWSVWQWLRNQHHVMHAMQSLGARQVRRGMLPESKADTRVREV